VVSIPIYVLFAAKDEEVRGFVAALSAGGLLGVSVILKNIPHNRGFWGTLAAIAVLHILLVALVPWPAEISFGIAFAPIVILDMYASARLIILAAGSQP
jgi:hypothetical protein